MDDAERERASRRVVLGTRSGSIAVNLIDRKQSCMKVREKGTVTNLFFSKS